MQIVSALQNKLSQKYFFQIELFLRTHRPSASNVWQKTLWTGLKRPLKWAALDTATNVSRQSI